MVSASTTRLVLRAAFLAVLLAVVSHTRAEPDLFGHVRFGHDLVAHRSPVMLDQYSFTTDRPWVNHEWASEALMYLVYAAGGPAGLIALKVGLLGLLLAIVVKHASGAGASNAIDFLAAVAVLGTFAQTNQIRPQLLSLVLFALLLVVLLEAQRRPGILWAAAPIMMLWANVHGGWLVGAGVLAVWTAAGTSTNGTGSERWVAWSAVGAAIAATLINPYGWRLWAFLAETVRFNRMEINDGQPVFSLGIAYGLLWSAVAGLAVAAMSTPFWPDGETASIRMPETIVVSTLAIAAFRVNRLLAFFTLATVILLAPQLGCVVGRIRSGRADRPPSRLAAATALALAIAILAGGVVASARNLSCIRMDTAIFPEQQVASIAARSGVRGRMLTWFDWGEYAIWYFSPDVSVSMDGRRETVYSARTIEDHLRFYYVPSSRPVILDAIDPDYIWLPATLDVRDLVAGGWRPVYAGPRSVLLGRDFAGAASGAIGRSPGAPTLPGAALSPRCFPGP